MRTKKLIASAMSGTRLPSIHITAAQGPAACLDSQFGGIFYLPQGEKIPVCPEGEEMRLIAQINFAQIPAFKGFPQNGILQFFVDTEIERFQNKVDNEAAKKELYTVRYYPQPKETLQTEEKPLPPSKLKSYQANEHLHLPWLKGKMSFQLQKEIATLSFGMDNLVTDFGYQYAIEKINPLMLKLSGYDIENWEFDTDDFCWDFGNWGCKIGGHPAIRQMDLRSESEEYQRYTTLLFQYDLSTKEEMEQDTFSFFIKPEDLAARRFDDVLLCWHNCF